jgi:hypothetical protein
LLRQLKFRNVASPPKTPRGFEFVSATISSDGRGIFIYVEQTGKSKVLETVVHASGAQFPKTKMTTMHAFKLIVMDDRSSKEVDIPSVSITFPKVDLFCDGKVLLAGSRCEWRGPDDFDKNAVIHDPQAGDTQQLLLGDGIADIGIDASDRIWVSYFDEGVFGNFGWGRPPAPTGFGAGGLVCFASSGQELWSFNGAGGDGFIDDCYALNVTRSDVWAYYYTDFKVCHIDQHFQCSDVWTPSVKGAGAIAIDQTNLLLSRQYNETPDTFHLVCVNAEDGLEKLQGKMPDKTPFDSNSLRGHGNDMHHIDANGWYCASIGEVAR